MSPRQPRIRVGVCIIEGGHILLVRHRKPWGSTWMLPGGGLEWGESLADCGVRELREETGYDVRVGDLMVVSESISPDSRRHVLNIVLRGEVCGGSRQLPAEALIDAVEWLPMEDLETLDLHPAIGREVLQAWLMAFPPGGSYLGRRWVD